MDLCDRGLFVSQGGCGEPKAKKAREARDIFFLIIFVLFL